MSSNQVIIPIQEQNLTPTVDPTPKESISCCQWMGRTVKKVSIAMGIIAVIFCVAIATFSSDNEVKILSGIASFIFTLSIISVTISSQNELTSNIRQFSTENTRLGNDVNNLRISLKNAQEQSTRVSHSLEEELKRSSETAKRLEDQTLTITSLTKQLGDSSAEIDALRPLLQNCHATTAQMETIIKKLHSKAGLVDSRLIRLASTSDSLRREREEMKATSTSITTEVRNLDQLLISVKKILDITNDNSIQTREEVQSLRGELSHTQQMTVNALTVIEREEETAKIENNLDSQIEAHHKAEEELRALTQELDSLKKKEE